MNKKIALATFVLLLSLAPSSAHGKAAKRVPASDDLVVKVFEMGYYFGQINAKVTPELERQTQEQVIVKSQADKIADYIRRVYTRSNLESFAGKLVSEKLDVNILRKFRGWYSSKPIAKKLLAAFLLRDNPAYQMEKDKYYLTYGQGKIKKNRINVIRTYLINSKTLEKIAGSELGARYAIDMGRDGMRPKGTQERSIAIYNRLKPVQTFYLSKPTDEVLKDYVYIFKDLTNREIDAYSKFLTTPLGIKIVKAAEEIYTSTIQQAGATVSRRIVKERASTYIPDL